MRCKDTIKNGLFLLYFLFFSSSFPERNRKCVYDNENDDYLPGYVLMLHESWYMLSFDGKKGKSNVLYQRHKFIKKLGEIKNYVYFCNCKKFKN